MDKTALLIIDMQVAMYSNTDDLPYRGDEVLDNIGKILKRAREIKMPVVFVQHTTVDEFKKGTPTWEICPQIAPLETESIVEKSKCDSFYKTNLEAVLDTIGVESLIIMGMQSEFCLDTTCRRAFSLGYNNTLVEDAHTTFDSKLLTGAQISAHHNSVLGGRFVELKSTNDVLAIMQ